MLINLVMISNRLAPIVVDIMITQYRMIQLTTILEEVYFLQKSTLQYDSSDLGKKLP